MALAQFGNFFQQGFPFGGHHHQQQQPQEGGRTHKGWQEMDAGELSVVYSAQMDSKEKLDADE